MKYAYWFLVLIVALPAVLFLIPMVASELGGEVVTLERPEENGEPSHIRVWIVDSNGTSWIEHGDAQSYYLSQLQPGGTVILERGGQVNTYVGSKDPASHDLYHDLRREKYGWADQVIEAFSGSRSFRSTSTPSRSRSVLAYSLRFRRRRTTRPWWPR